MTLKLPKSLLDPNKTFDTFVVGGIENSCAYDKAYRFSELQPPNDPLIPNNLFKPLIISGDSGLGKTHLLQAVVWRIKELFPDKKVLYLTAEQFFLFYADAIRGEKIKQFRNIFDSLDVLVIDDFDFICGKQKTQDEFFNILRSLHSSGKIVALSSKHSAMRFFLDEKIIFSFAPVGKATYGLRLKLLQEKVKTETVAIPDEVLDFLAKNVTSNIRNLLGAFKRIVAHSELIGEPLTLETTQSILNNMLQSEKPDLFPDLLGKSFDEIVSDFHRKRRNRLIKMKGKKELEIEEKIKDSIKRHYFLEGEDEDYYFSDLSVNDYTMLFCKDSRVYDKFEQICKGVFSEYDSAYKGKYSDGQYTDNLEATAIGIHFITYICDVDESDIRYCINITVKDEFFNSLKNDSKRWEAFLKLHNKPSLKELFGKELEKWESKK